MAGDRHLALVPLLTRHFPRWLEYFVAHGPFKKPDQLGLHQQSIRMRCAHASVVAALRDDAFLRSVYDTLRAWGIGSRRSHLKPPADFCNALRRSGPRLSRLETLAIDDPSLDVDGTIGHIWSIVDELGIVGNDARLVAGTKAIHHILPDLVPPMDRAYTQRFFGWNNPQFQYGQEACFRVAFGALASVARDVKPRQFVGSHPWHTSPNKVIDNAVVGLLRAAQDGQVEVIAALDQ